MKLAGWQGVAAGLLALAATGALAALLVAARPFDSWLVHDLGVI